MINKNFLKQKGLVLTELLLTIFVISLTFGIIYSSYMLNQRASKRSVRVAELAQNGRVIIERISREIRQAKTIVTNLSDQEFQATNTIMFEDGHVDNPYNYIRYFQENNVIKREAMGYYFSGDLAQELVPWNSIPPFGQSLSTTSIELPQAIGEYINVFKFWGSRSIYIYLELEKDGEALEMESSVFPRNL